MAEVWGWIQIGLALLIMSLCGALMCAWAIAARRLRRLRRRPETGDKETGTQGDKQAK